MKNNKDKKTTEQDQLRNPTTHEVLREVEKESQEERVSGDRRTTNDSHINTNQQNTSEERDTTRSVAGPGGERSRRTGSGLNPKRSVTGSDFDGQPD